MIIGVIGPKGSGKSAVAEYLVNKQGFVRHRFAEPLKNALMVAFGLTREQVDGSLKETPTDKLCGRTPRHAMVTMGTEWGRQIVHPDIWTIAWRNTLPKGDIVVDDVRFPNEHAAVLGQSDSTIISVRRPGFEYDQSHESEAHSELAFNHQIINDGSIEDLNRELANLCFGFRI